MSLKGDPVGPAHVVDANDAVVVETVGDIDLTQVSRAGRAGFSCRCFGAPSTDRIASVEASGPLSGLPESDAAVPSGPLASVVASILASMFAPMLASSDASTGVLASPGPPSPA